MKALAVQLKAGKIKRWHAFPIIGEQTVADHSYGVAQILRYLYHDRIHDEVLMAALDHDVAEIRTGDVPYSAKKADPELRKTLHDIEKVFNVEHNIQHRLGKDEAGLLHFADLAEMGFFGIHQWALGSKSALTIVKNVLDALPDVNSNRAESIRVIFEDFIHEQSK